MHFRKWLNDFLHFSTWWVRWRWHDEEIKVPTPVQHCVTLAPFVVSPFHFDFSRSKALMTAKVLFHSELCKTINFSYALQWIGKILQTLEIREKLLFSFCGFSLLKKMKNFIAKHKSFWRLNLLNASSSSSQFSCPPSIMQNMFFWCHLKGVAEVSHDSPGHRFRDGAKSIIIINI